MDESRVIIKAGDQVRLRGGGPWMTVRYIKRDYPMDAVNAPLLVYCNWFDSSNAPCAESFYVEQLITFNEDETIDKIWASSMKSKSWWTKWWTQL